MPIQGPIPFPPRRQGARRCRRSFPLWPVFTVLAVVLVPLLGFGAWFWWSATHWESLVENTPGAHAHWAVTLAGEGDGSADRTECAMDLLRQGRVENVVISGTPIIASTYMSTVILAGEPLSAEERRHFLEARHASQNTVDEARALVPAMRSLGADTVLLVTSNFHSRRAADIFRTVSQGKPVFIPVASDWQAFHLGWKSRQAAKTWFMEWCKTLWWKLVEKRAPHPLRVGDAIIVRYPEAGDLSALGAGAPPVTEAVLEPKPEPKPKPVATPVPVKVTPPAVAPVKKSEPKKATVKKEEPKKEKAKASSKEKKSLDRSGTTSSGSGKKDSRKKNDSKSSKSSKSEKTVKSGSSAGKSSATAKTKSDKSSKKSSKSSSKTSSGNKK